MTHLLAHALSFTPMFTLQNGFGNQCWVSDPLTEKINVSRLQPFNGTAKTP